MDFAVAFIVLTGGHFWLKKYKWYRYFFVPNSSIEASRKLIEEHGYSEEEVDFGLRRENRFRSGEWIGVFIVFSMALLGLVYFISRLY